MLSRRVRLFQHPLLDCLLVDKLQWGGMAAFSRLIHRLVRLLLLLGAGGVLGYLLALQLMPDAGLADGARYYGPLQDGLMHGEGRLHWPNGSVYEGAFQAGELSGEGRLVNAAGEIYQGTMQHGMMHGPGLLELPDGGSYQGEFERGQLVRGVYADTHGGLHQGNFHHWRLHGTGRLSLADGSEYSGEFRHGAPVRGHFRDAAGGYYQGTFAEGAFDGEGEYTDADGNVYRGIFRRGQLTGEGSFEGADGHHYQGEFAGGLFQGQGTLTYANGDRYQGEFAYGQPHGEGRREFADERPPQQGGWRQGRFLPALTAQQAEIAESVEPLLYNQPALLEQALAAVASGDDAINLYLLAIAGDGTQEVFRREVEYVSEMFGHWFDTGERHITLINSRTTTGTYPLATITSVRRALARLAEQMDSERDILFVFLTSHGSADHQFSLQQRGLSLPALPAATLADLLAESGIRWKVVLVSACYSGGFIPPLADEQTLVMTAARADRTSFGCSDEADFTYFGGAYFRDTLAADGDFVAAFHKAKARVLEREAEEGITVPSEPQIHAPEPILAQLRAWRASRD